MSDTEPYEIKFPSVRHKNLIRLGEDLLHAFSIPAAVLSVGAMPHDLPYLSSINSLMWRRGGADQLLEETFRKAVSELHSYGWVFPMLSPWLRLYAHALLRETRIFPGMELRDESPGCSHNGFADIWKGDHHGEPVCIKVIRTRKSIPLEKIKKVYRVVREGGKLGPHPNVLPVIEVSEASSLLCIMSPWMSNGNITQYTQANPDASRLTLLVQACRGLMYLPGLGILHGNIAPNNILVTRDGQACLGEFGITGSFPSFDAGLYEITTIRYMAPECLVLDSLDQEPNRHSKESDVYSLAMTSFTVLTGVLPHDVGNQYRICDDVKGGARPPRPTGVSRKQWLQDPVWNVITAGWHYEPEQRCKLPVVYRVFLTSSYQGVRNAKIGRWQLGKFLPQVASFFQLIQDSESKVQRRVNEIDKRLEDDTTPDHERIKLFNELCKNCSRHRVVPKSMHIPDCSEGSVEVECGGFANVSQSTYEGRRVAVKVVCMYITSDLDVILSGFCREGVAWKHLRHPNILPLLGVTVSEHRFALVSEWMENGNINEFIERDCHVNRTELLVGVANGMKYMHDLHIVHGDLKGANILINGDGRACIADFGLSTITGVATAAGASRASLISNDSLMSFTGGGTRRWMSPELLYPEGFGISESENNRPTRQSDCYALGMVIYEVLCGHHPYPELSDAMAVNAIMEGVRPRKPKRANRLGFSDELWRIVELCWLEDRNARPCAGDILSCLTDATVFWYMRDY